MNTVQLVQTLTVPSGHQASKYFSQPRLPWRENFRPTQPGLPRRAVALVPISGFIDCFCLSSRRDRLLGSGESGAGKRV